MTLTEIKKFKGEYILYYDDELGYNFKYGNFNRDIKTESDLNDFETYVNNRLWLYNNFKITCENLRDRLLNELKNDFDIDLKNKKYDSLNDFVSELVSLYNNNRNDSYKFIAYLQTLQKGEIKCIWYLKDRHIPTIEIWNNQLKQNDEYIDAKNISYKDIITTNNVFSIHLNECDRIYNEYDLYKYI